MEPLCGTQTDFGRAADEPLTFEGTERAPLALLSEKTDRNDQDDYGNVIQQDTNIYDVDAGVSDGRSERIHAEFLYDNFEPSWLIGQLMRVDQSNEDRSGKKTGTEFAYEYVPKTGLLSRVAREPHAILATSATDSDFYSETKIDRNVYGLVTSATTSGSGHKVSWPLRRIPIT